MRIGMTTFGGDGGKSGISKYIIGLLRGLQALDSDEELELFVYEREADLFAPDRERIAVKTFRETMRHPVLSILWHQLALPRWCRRERYDVMFFPAGNRRLPWRVPCPSVGTVHDFSSLHVEGKYDALRMLYIRRILPAWIRQLTRILTVSESSKRDIVEHVGVPEDRVIVTPLAADRSIYHPRERDEARSRIHARYRFEGPYILYVSRIEHPGKNHVRLIRAFERLKRRGEFPHRLVLAGSDWARAEEVHRVAESTACRDDIVFTGFAADEDLPFFYSGADALVFPSLYEGFGLPVLEAMSCGTPTGCSDISSMPEVAGDAALLFDPHVEEAIESAMRRLISDSALAARLREDGIGRSREFTWERTARQTLEALRSVVHEEPAHERALV